MIKAILHAKFKSCGLGFTVSLPFTAALFQNVTSMYTVCKQTYFTLTASRDQYQNFKLLHFPTFHHSKFTSLDFLEVSFMRRVISPLLVVPLHPASLRSSNMEAVFFRIILSVSLHSFSRSLVNIKIL